MKNSCSLLSKYNFFLMNTPFTPKLFPKYVQHIVTQDLILKYNYKNIMEIGKIEKIVCSTTSKIYVSEKKYIIPAAIALELISSQKPVWTYAKHSIATFKIREKQILGCKVDLRKQSLYNFFEKWCRVIVPRIREISKLDLSHFEIQGNFSFGMSNVMVFPELESHFEIMENFRGVNMNFILSTTNTQEALLLLSAFQIPSSFLKTKITKVD